MDNNIPYEENSVEIHAELFDNDLDNLAYEPIESNDDIGENEFGY